MIKILEDTLKSPNGKWSRKSLTMFSSWIMAILSGIFRFVLFRLVFRAVL